MVRHYAPDEQLPDGVCPSCRSAVLPSGSAQCQACGLAAGVKSPAERSWPDLSHGHDGHVCIPEGAAMLAARKPESDRELEA